VADAPLAGLKVQDPHATAGQNTGTYTVATFSDLNAGAPVGDFTASITWGDGTSSTVSASGRGIVSQGGGVFALLSSHTYGSSGSFTLSVLVSDVGTATIAGSRKIAVSYGGLHVVQGTVPLTNNTVTGNAAWNALVIRTTAEGGAGRSRFVFLSANQVRSESLKVNKSIVLTRKG
jgi:hypothetical protein